MIELRPISKADANRAVEEWHRHHDPVGIHRFCVAAYTDNMLQGVVIVGNPKAPGLQNGTTFEVVRLCTRPNAETNVATRLLGSAWRASKAMGIRRLVSYTRFDEAGTCYRAAGWIPTAKVAGRGWTTGNKRNRWLPGLYQPSTEIVDRMRWEIST